MTNTNQYHTANNTRQSLFGIAWFPLALCLIGAGLEDASAAQTATLVLTGNAAPDGNGTFSDFGIIQTLNANGEVAFVCDFTGTQNPSTDSSGICLASTKSITQLVRTGDPAPDGNGIFKYFAYDFNHHQRVVLNDNGKVAFAANLTGTAGGSTDNFGLFGASALGGVKQFVRIPDAAPDGNGVFAETPPDGI